MHCRLCNNTNIKMIKKGTRDRPDINVLRCEDCGLVFLSDVKVDNAFYTESLMRKQIDFDSWRKNTYEDDKRRFLQWKKIINGKTIVDFGCGNGGFLKFVKDSGCAKDVIGIDLDIEAVTKLTEEGITCYSTLDDLKDIEPDIIFMFHVIEHLPNPEELLNSFRSYMTSQKEHQIIIETPNADDALLSIYECKEFADFTYWSPHIYLYNENTLKILLHKAGFKMIEIIQEQRYSLANHLRWLSRGLPRGGIQEFQELNDPSLNVAYAKVLGRIKACDTLVCIIRGT